MVTSPHPPLLTQQITIVDAEGRPRLRLSADGGPTVEFMGADGTALMSLALDDAGHASVVLDGPGTDTPSARLEIDEKGAHLRLSRPGEASSYLFLNNQGAGGVVLVDRQGVRRSAMRLSATGESGVERFDAAGAPL